MSEQRNVIIAVVLSICILLGYQYLFIKPKSEQIARQMAEQATTEQSEAPKAPGSVNVGDGADAAKVVRDRAEVLTEVPRIAVKTPHLSGSISLKGARLDDITLPTYRETLAADSPAVTLLSPSGSEHPYFVELGWSTAEKGVALPNNDSLWTANASVLTPDKPLELRWANGQGLTFVRTVAVDDKYVFTVTQKVENASGKAVTLYPYGLIARVGIPTLSGYSVLHEGPLGVMDGTLQEITYKKLKEKNHEYDSTGGWVGITDKYWLAALLFDQKSPTHAKFTYRDAGGKDRFQVDYLSGGITVAPGESKATTARIFVGAKEVRTISAYEDKFNVTKFDLAIDFGWFYFLTKPFFYILEYLYHFFNNFGFAILGLVVIVRGAMFPLANKSFRSMNAMKRVQPEMKKLQERYKDDKPTLQREMMALYKREHANPMSGCLPLVVQIPVFFALYKVLFITIEMRHAPFYGWIADLSVQDPTNVFTAFGLIPWVPPEFLHLGAWPLIMGISMWLLQKMSPAPPDPTQAKLMMMMPIIFTFMLAKFPAGLVIYWSFSNVLSILQQWLLAKTTPDPHQQHHPKGHKAQGGDA